MIYFKKIMMALFFTLPLLTSCEDEDKNTLTATVETISVEAAGGTNVFTLNTNASSWSIENTGTDWLTLSTTSGTSTQAMISWIVNSKTIETRTATLTIKAGNADPIKIVVTQFPSDYLYNLTSSATTLSLKMSGSTGTFTLTTDAPQWTITSDASWLTLNKTSGTDKEVSIMATSAANETGNARTATITLTAEYAQSATVTVTQAGPLYPSYNTSPIPNDITGMSSTASQLAKKISLGWNLGNSMEVPYSETGWGNPKTTQSIINTVKEAGFNAVRIPCAWDSHSDPSTAKIFDTWLARVKEVIDYCIINDMYVIINIHWDGGWLENNITTAKQEEVNQKQKAFWEQIATYFRDYDEHLIFAGCNEPNADDATEMAVLLGYEQTFIDAVRSTGGKNYYRNLIIQGPSTDIDHTNNYMNTLPTDAVQNRLMMEVHYYAPWQFCGLTADANWGNMAYFWGTGNLQDNINGVNRNAPTGESAVNTQFAKMKSKFVDRGIPVILGEYGAIKREMNTTALQDAHNNSRAAFLKHVTMTAKNNGMIPIYWDNGASDFKIINRSNNAIADQQALDALTQGASAGNYPF
ncbi:MAG: cellulase family glycosylhydrolase [Marinilabiliaceae bacterium]|nr:cellulase family glycosylhydrolase [Marinilabiliaceae bacterium]